MFSQAWLGRLQRLIDAADKLGMVPIVQFFYYAQFGAIEAAALPAAVTTISKWLAALPNKNFLVVSPDVIHTLWPAESFRAS